MREWFDEVLIVLSNSWRTQLFIVLGPIIAVAVLLFTEPTIATLQSTGFRITRLIVRVEYAALGLVLSSWAQAWRCYKKDRKRLLGL